ncbi:MAG: hypothetical protein ACTSQF_13215 [Candidatus Heimdallarchaeaceae archaeon]
MVQRKYSNIIFCFLIIVNLTSINVLTDAQSDIASNDSILPSKISSEAEIDSFVIESYENPGIFPNQPQLLYTPIDSHNGAGNDFSIIDELSVSHETSITLDLGNSLQDSFTIQQPASFNDDYLQYNMTVTPTQDDYEIHAAAENKHQDLYSNVMVSQAFQISWDYGVFYSANINLELNGPTLGNDEIIIYVVSEDGLGEPNLADIRAYETNGPYNSSNLIPASTYGDYATYDFVNTTLDGEAILEEGTYFVVVEQTVADINGAEFDWLGKVGEDVNLPCYVYDGATWSKPGPAETRGLVVRLLPSDSNGNALQISDPSTINLYDGAVPITSFSQDIAGSGIHTLSSNTSVNIVMNNTYSFDRTILATSSYVVTNSSHLANTVDWTLSWSIGSLNLFNYTNPSRTQEIITSSDWHDTVFDLLVNGSVAISGVKSSLGYDFDLNPILSVGKYDSGDFVFTTSSPNYLLDLSLNSLSFDLGYWETDEVNATGYSGSAVTADIFVNDSSTEDVLTGSTNFTLYDPDGFIVPVKNDSLYPLLFYNDLSSYTLLETIQSAPGQFTANTMFDPSFDGTDKEGYWTAVAFWQNGTEIGFYSLQISVRKSTTASFMWETTDGGSWSNSSSITRINEETIRVQITYNNISDPFYSGEGTPITAAPVSYTTSWGTSGQLTYVGPFYEENITLDAEEGIHSIDLIATGTLLQEHIETIDINVLHTFDIDDLPDASPEFFNDDYSLIQFRVRDLTNGSITVVPDEMFFYLDDVLLTQFTDYNTTIQSDRISLYLYSSTADLNLAVDSYTIKIEVTKDDYVVEYGIDTATAEIPLEILPVPIEVQIIESDEEIYQNNVTSVTFVVVDTIHDVNITDADIEISFDITEASLVDIYEVDGIYTVTVRVLEPQETSIHIHITVTKAGYVSIIDFPSPEVTINIPGEPEGIPFYLFIIIGIFGSALILIPTIFLIRRKMDTEKRSEKALFSRIYGLYSSVLAITKLIAVHKATGLPVYEMDLGSEISLDPSLITGFLSAISSMGVELRGDRAGASM